MSHRSERGFTLIEIIIAAIIAVAALGVGAVAVASTGHAFVQSAEYRHESDEIEALVNQLSISANTSAAIFTPASCGNASGYAYGDNQPCGTSVRFYARDASGGTHYWGWEYDQSKGTLTQCLNFSGPDGVCNSTGSVLNGILSFTATPRDAQHIAAAYGLSAAPEEYEMLDAATDANQRVVAGNRVMVIDVANAAVVRETHLVQGGVPFSTVVLTGAVTAPAVSSPTQVSPSSGFIFTTYADPGSLPGRVQDSGYGAYQQYAGTPYWTASACTTTVWFRFWPRTITLAYVSYNPNQAGDYLDYTVTPAANASGSCTITISTKLGGSVSIPVTIYAVPVYHLTVSAPSPNPANVGTPALMTASSVLTNSSAVRPNTWPSTISAGVQAASGPCSYAPAGDQPSGTQFHATGSAAGTCTLQFTAPEPQYASVDDNPQTVSFTIASPCTNPNYQMQWSTPASPLTVGSSETFQISAPNTSAGAQNPCPAPAQAPISITSYPGGVCSASPLSGSPLTVTVTGLAQGTCTISFADNTGGITGANASQSGSVTIQIAQQQVSACGTPSPVQLTQVGGAAVSVNQLKKDADSGLTGRDGKPLTSDGSEAYGFFDYAGSIGNPKGVYYMTENNDGTISFVMFNSYSTQLYGTPNQINTLTDIANWFQFNMPWGTALDTLEGQFTGTMQPPSYSTTDIFAPDPTQDSPQVLFTTPGAGATGPNRYGIGGYNYFYNPTMWQLIGFTDGTGTPIGAGNTYPTVLMSQYTDAAPIYEPVPGTSQNMRVLRVVWYALAANGTVIPIPSVVQWSNSGATGGTGSGGNNVVLGMSTVSTGGLALKCQNYSGKMPAVAAPQKPTQYSWAFKTLVGKTTCIYSKAAGEYRCSATFTATLQSNTNCTISGTLKDSSPTKNDTITLPDPDTVTSYWPLTSSGWSTLAGSAFGASSTTVSGCPLNPNPW